ncbi:ATP-binding protein [Streptomyces sp. NPDC047043]|uniref:sensor histidine kinase n=1 Tax=Streptomyces sp. NPDC047043 TaxID=3154497 RepID=UPI003405591A
MVLELARAREAVAQEQALLGAAKVRGTLTQAQYVQFVGAVATRRELLQPAVADLKAAHRAAYQKVLGGDGYAQLQAVENRVQSAGPGATAVSAGFLKGRDSAASGVLNGLTAAETKNAAAFSPPSAKVQLGAARMPEGVLIEVEDSGFGRNEEVLAEVNRKIQSDRVDLLDAKQIGLFVVNRLRERQGLRVEVRSSPGGGVTATVLIPENLTRDDMPVGEAAVGGRGLAPAAALIPHQRFNGASA